MAKEHMHGYIKDYPRPQLVRKSWELLNGQWEFEFDEAKTGEKRGLYKCEDNFSMNIEVPFTYETKLSGIGIEEAKEAVWYKRTVNISEDWLASGHVLFHFEGVDYEAKVWLNGHLVGTHRGAYARFSMDITDYAHAGENTLVVLAKDSYDLAIPRGKQRWKNENFGCWYVQTTGIWKSVWMEHVGSHYIKSLKITPSLAEKKVLIEALVEDELFEDDLCMDVKVTFEDKLIKASSTQVNYKEAKIEIPLERPDLFEWSVFEWRPEWPSLYDLDIKIKNMDSAEVYDEVTSYFGLRDIKIDKGSVLLNGAPLYQRLILDQGYWKDSHLTPPSEEALIKDIDTVMAMGYNGVRKHQKLEDERFLYWADVKGLLVWSEVGAAYKYSDAAVSEFTEQWMEIVKQNYSHPSIITWTPFNESWGVLKVKNDRTEQHFTESIYHLTKSFDAMRPVIVNDGWEHTVSDIITLHDYEEKGEVFFERYTKNWEDILNNKVYHCGNRSAFANGFEYKGQPVIISEFGGIALDGGSGWGYGNKVENKDDFIKRFASITNAIKKLPNVCGYCYTQVSDVQQEINGLMDEERNVKIDLEIIKKINLE